MDDVYVVEAAFTGPGGFPQDRVVQVSVCRMHRDGTDFDTVYDSFVYADPKDIGKPSLDYLSDNYGITAETLYMSPPEDIVVRELLGKLRGRECTSFNVNRTFGQFLCVEPWDLNGEVTFLPSISSRLPPEYAGDLASAYRYATPGNPMDVRGTNSMDQCLMSTSIMMRLRRSGLFRSEVTEYRPDVEQRVGGGQQEQQEVYDERTDGEDSGEYPRDHDQCRSRAEQEQSADEESESHPVRRILVDDAQPEQSEEAGYDGQQQLDLIALLSGLLSRGPLPGSLGLERDLGIAFGTGQAIRGHWLAAFGTVACHSVLCMMNPVHVDDAMSFPSDEYTLAS